MESCLLKEATGENAVYAFTVVENYYEERKLRKAGELDELICPGCRRPVHLRYGYKKMIRPHFAHKVDDVNHSCNFNEESMTHILGKETLYNYFRSKYTDVDIRFDYKLPIGRKPNLHCIFPDGNELAVEFQKTNMSVTEWEERSECYKSNDIKVLWILNFLDHEYDVLQASNFLSFFKQMVLHDSDNRLLLLNIDKKVLTVSRGVEYHVMDRHYDLGLISRDYPLDEIHIQTDGTIPCDLDEEYERQFYDLKETIDKMLQEEENRQTELESKKNAYSARQSELDHGTKEAGIRNQDEPIKTLQENNLIDREKMRAASRPDSGDYASTRQRVNKGQQQKSYTESRSNLSKEENKRRINTTKGLYTDLVRQASKGDISVIEKLRRVYRQSEDKRELIDTIIEEDITLAKVLIRIRG